MNGIIFMDEVVVRMEEQYGVFLRAKGVSTIKEMKVWVMRKMGGKEGRKLFRSGDKTIPFECK